MTTRATIIPKVLRSLIVDAQAIEVLDALESAGIPALLLKGRSTRELLYEPGEQRSAGDIDLLIAPGDGAAAEQRLRDLGFARVYMSDRWRRDDGAEVDLHHRMRLVGASPEQAWATLWSERASLRIRDRDVAVLSVAARALLFAIQVAYRNHRHHRAETLQRAQDELELAIERLEPHVWHAALRLAAALDANHALATGLQAGGSRAKRLHRSLGLPASPAPERRPPPEGPSPFAFFDAIFCLNLDSATARWQLASERFAELGISKLVERVPAVATPEDHHLGCALSFRAMIAEARRRRYRHVLILEDDAIFRDDTIAIMRAAVAELAERDWDLFYLGGASQSFEFPFVDGSSVLQRCDGVTCTHAVAIHSAAYAKILESGCPPPIDQTLYRAVRDRELRALIVSPRVASQPYLLQAPWGDLRHASRFVI